MSDSRSKWEDMQEDKLVLPKEIFFISNNPKTLEILKENKLGRNYNILNESDENSVFLLVNNTEYNNTEYNDNLGTIKPNSYCFCTRNFYEKCEGLNLYHITDLGLNLLSPEHIDKDLITKPFSELNEEQKDLMLTKAFKRQFNNTEDFKFERVPEDLMGEYKKYKELEEAAKNKEGVKFSTEKAPMATMLRQFPLALEAVAFRSKVGHEKYKEVDHDWMNFKRVPNAIEQYSDASVRHLAGIGDDEDDLGHLKAAAWNILATLQLILEEKETTDG